MPLIWTDDDDRVTHSHYNPDELSYTDAKGAIEVDEIPDPDPEMDGTPELHYTDTDGFYYTYE